MYPGLSEEQKERIAAHLNQGLSPDSIAGIEHVSAQTIRKIRSHLRTYGQHTAPRVSKLGRPTWLTAPIRAGLAAYLEARPWAYLDEMEYYLFDDWGIIVNKPTISRALKTMHISHKVLKRKAKERSQLCRDLYHLEISEYTANQLIYLDESAANEQTRFRKRGWAAYGLSPIVTRPVKRLERWSVLPAYNIDGILAWHIYQGGISGAYFEWFLQEEVLLWCTLFPGNNSVLIMDNASKHHSEVSFEVYFNIKNNVLICDI